MAKRKATRGTLDARIVQTLGRFRGMFNGIEESDLRVLCVDDDIDDARFGQAIKELLGSGRIEIVGTRKAGSEVSNIFCVAT
jgi:hypothetical protein